MAKEKPQIKLNKKELAILSQTLFNSRWTVKETQETIIPLINKLGKMDNELSDKIEPCVAVQK